MVCHKIPRLQNLQAFWTARRTYRARVPAALRLIQYRQQKMSLFCLIILLMLCYHVMSQTVSFPLPTRTSTPTPTLTPTPTPTPSPSPLFSHPLDCPFNDTSLCDPQCPYVNFECPAGLIPSTRTFAQSDICEPLFSAEFNARCSFVFDDQGNIRAYKC